MAVMYVLFSNRRQEKVLITSSAPSLVSLENDPPTDDARGLQTKQLDVSTDKECRLDEAMDIQE